MSSTEPATRRRNEASPPTTSYLEALLEETTPGPWIADQSWLRGPRDVFMGGFGYGDTPKDQKKANALLCALARVLAQEVIDLRESLLALLPEPSKPAASDGSATDQSRPLRP